MIHEMTPLPYAGWPEPAHRKDGTPILAIKRLDPAIAWDIDSMNRYTGVMAARMIETHTNRPHGRQEKWLCD